MKAPISMLKAPGGAKAAVVIAMLAGLFFMTAMKRGPAAPTPPPRR
jgi:multisubunit Na+/H+ antiporter MnhB subunit